MAGLFDTLIDKSSLSFITDELKQNYTRNLDTNSNIVNNPVYLQGITKIKPMSTYTPEGIEASGYYEPSSPGILNVSYKSPDVIKTTGHEAYHSQAYDYGKWLNAYKDWNENPNLLGLRALDYSPYSSLSQEHNDFRKRVKDVYEKYEKDYNLNTRFTGHPSEMMADLQGIEAKLPSGKTILDTDIGKDLFKTKEEKQLYLKSSLPGIMKAIEYDPSLWEVAKDRADYAMRVFKDKATASSYANAAAQAFKAFMSGPEAKVEYKDPFGDTTK